MSRLRLQRPVQMMIIGIMMTACGPNAPIATPPASPDSWTDHVVISEVMAGVGGDNNREFIELYNPGPSALDLDGWRLVYRLPSSTQDLVVQAWQGSALVPAQGHYLLVREGEDVGVPPDALFRQALNTRNGGLALKDQNENTVDSLAWGNGPVAMTEGHPATALQDGSSLERRPGAEAGNGSDTQDNRADFTLSDSPQPQDSGSLTAPTLPSPLHFTVSLPSSALPGERLTLTMEVANHGSSPVSNLTAGTQLPQEIQVTQLPMGVAVDSGRLVWTLDALGPGQAATAEVTLRAPWRQGSFGFRNQFATAAGLPRMAFSQPGWFSVQDGPIPIGVARTLLDQDLTVEGVSTIYSGGLFAGSGNTKFYLSDSSGGVQVWVPGGGLGLDVPLGFKVRVRGRPQIYRGTVELVADSPQAVEVLGEMTPWPAEPVDLSQTQLEPDVLAGRLIRVQGDLTHLVDETYGYDLTLTDEEGWSLIAYIDKLTGLQVEGLALDQPYAVTGIFETPDDVPTLYPRIANDIERLYPPELGISVQMPASAGEGETFQVTATLANHTGADLEEITVQTDIPASAQVIRVEPDGRQEGSRLSWSVPLLVNGGQASVSYQARPAISEGVLSIPAFEASHAALRVISSAGRLFVGSTVPIWAIQGDGPRSPYVLQTLSTQGVVTGVFPGLSGFWIQSLQPDQDRFTSDGLFIFTGLLRTEVAQGNVVQVRGQIRELGEQTQLEVQSPSDVQLIRHASGLPAPVALDPPADDEAALAYNEAHEGMLVTVDGPAVAVGPTSIYGEYTLILASHGVERIMQGRPAGWRIVVDDGEDTVHDDRSGLPYVVAVGDYVQAVTGPLAFTYGQHKIEPISQPRVVPGTRQLPQLSPTAPDEFRLMSWNAENLFDALPPHPSDPPPPTPAEYQRNLAKVASTIVAAGAPTVVALQEVENIDILHDLASLPVLIAYQYEAHLMEGTDSRGIDVGYLVRVDRAEVTAERQVEAPDGLMSRPPLLIEVHPLGAQGLLSVTLLNNHFTSLSAGIELTQPRRTQQAEVNADIVRQILSQEPGARVAVVGDLNSFYGSPPLQVLIGAGLSDAFDHLAPADRYDYIYQGIAETLDHILLSQGMEACLIDFQVLHLDSPFPPPPADDSSAVRKSDHDPIVASFRCPP